MLKEAKTTTKAATGKQYWRSLDELADTPRFREFVEREFPKHASEWLEDIGVGGASRRVFLKIMGASMALAGLAGCRRWPAENLAPYAHRPANRSDGVAVHYATALEMCGMGVGLVATSFDGRPTKVDGNPLHPLSAGAATTLVQASVLDLYDPDRSRGVVRREGGKRAGSSWEEFAKFAGEKIKKDGEGLVVLSEASRSPSVAAMRKKLIKAKWFEYEAISNDNQRAGAARAYGRPLRAVPQLDKAEVIVSIDADLFGGDVSNIKYGRDFAAGRKLHDGDHSSAAKMNRLWVIESGFTNTGSMADHRRGVKPSQVRAVVEALVAAWGGDAKAPELDGDLKQFVAALAADLKAHGGKSVIVAGGRVAPEVHAMVAGLNHVLGNVDKTVTYYADPEDPRPEAEWTPHAKQLEDFTKEAATAQAVLIIGANPVYTGSADLKIAKVLAAVNVSIHCGTHEDETARACTWHVPQAHYLEAWGDVRTFDGTVSIAQPLIEPLFGGKSTIELLSLLAGEGKLGYEIVRAVAKTEYLAGRFSEWTWKKSLFDGVVAGSARMPEAMASKRDVWMPEPRAAAATGMELVFVTGQVFDGRFANNGWLQELPDPMTRVTWDNTLLLSPKDAEKLGVSSDDVVTVSAGAGAVSIDDATVFVLPGQPEGVAGLALGYGRTAAGSIGNGVGSNAYALRTSGAYDYATGVAVSKTGRVNYLATVQDHHVIDPVGANRKRDLIPELVVEGTFAEYVKRPQLGTRKVVSLSMFDEHDYTKGYKWGLAIDLTTCTGCAACVVACQAENNVPIVGKDQVIRGREMHWLRIDRYFKHEKGSPQAVHQPVMCMHCENAPCEEVCPVAATTHSAEGLNMMTYNRCIGTRYCSNNCPYKVRRFNFFDFNAGTKENLYKPNLLREDLDDLLRMQKNPQVTVRSRGVMEKCTYCVQRIENARIQIRAENRGKADESRIADGVIQTACQQSCPTGAIVFGDLNDPKSRVTQLHKLAQAYGMLDPELNTKPRTQYLAKVRYPVEGLDTALYNTEKSEGYFFEEHEPAGKKVESDKGGEH